MILARFKILPKLVAVMGVIAVVVGCCVWYAQSQMTAIDDAYTTFIDREAKASANGRRVNRAIFELNYSLYRIIAETDGVQIKLANENFDAVLPLIKTAMSQLREQAPRFPERIDIQRGRVDSYVVNVSETRRLGSANLNVETINYIHGKIDHGFREIVDGGTRIADDISKYVEDGSAALTTQTNSTRSTLIISSAFGGLLGLSAAVVVFLATVRAA